MGLKQNTWKLNQWYDQDVAGNVSYSTSVGELWNWGWNFNGFLGQNQAPAQLVGYSSPTQVGSDTTWKDVSNDGEIGMLALKTDGTLWAWGSNVGDANGFLGQNESSTRYSSPVQIPGTDWDVVGNGKQTGVAIRTDGTLWVWGGNTAGALGLNDSVNAHKSSPTQIPGDWSGSTIGESNAWNVGIIKTNGTLWVWGQNNLGQLAQDDTARRSSPVQIPGTTWSDVAITNEGTTGGIKTDGTLWMWGSGHYGARGDNKRYGPSPSGGDNLGYSSPVQIPGTTWSKLTCNNYAFAAIKTDGTLWSWGYAGGGELGQNNLTSYSSPVQITGTTWAEVHSLASGGVRGVKTDGTLWAWGTGSQGQTAQNDRTSRSSPIQIPGTDWKGNKWGGTWWSPTVVKLK